MVYKLILEFDGENFHGFQKQPDMRTVQGEIEKVLSQILSEKIEIDYAGRTDAGVSAYEMPISFKTDKELDTSKILHSLNNLLSDDVKAKSFDRADDSFNARYSAKKKTYVYKIFDGESAFPLQGKGATFVYKKLNISLMKKAGRYFVGTHDFTSFCSTDCEKENKIRTIYSLKIKRVNDIINITISGNGFLQHMVRIIVGTLIDVGHAKLEPASVKDILEAKDRTKAKKTAAAKGLYLLNVEY